MLSKEECVRWLEKRTEEYRLGKNDMKEVVDDFDEVGKLGYRFSSMDELEEVDRGGGGTRRPTYINTNLAPQQKDRIMGLLQEFVGCFAWDYTEMLWLSRELVEHCLSIKQGFRPYRQPARNFSHEIVGKIKEEVDRLLKAKFVQPCSYVEWVSNVVPLEKKNTGNIRVYIDFRNLNRATPKDEYPMPITDVLINNASGHKVMSFLDDNASYNQIFMAKEDVSKMAFRCPEFMCLFEWIVMTFGLKNAGTTYQWVMNLIFHDLLGVILEVYIDDIVVKSTGFDKHMADLRLAFERMKGYTLKMNQLKCSFGVAAGKFLGFIVHEKGIQIDPKKVESIERIVEPTCKKDVQKLLGKINYLRRFVSNLAGRVESFLPLVRLRHEEDFCVGRGAKNDFQQDQRVLIITTST
jgi:hypothetical protein